MMMERVRKFCCGEESESILLYFEKEQIFFCYIAVVIVMERKRESGSVTVREEKSLLHGREREELRGCYGRVRPLCMEREVSFSLQLLLS